MTSTMASPCVRVEMASPWMASPASTSRLYGVWRLLRYQATCSYVSVGALLEPPVMFA